MDSKRRQRIWRHHFRIWTSFAIIGHFAIKQENNWLLLSDHRLIFFFQMSQKSEHKLKKSNEMNTKAIKPSLLLCGCLLSARQRKKHIPRIGFFCQCTVNLKQIMWYWTEAIRHCLRSHKGARVAPGSHSRSPSAWLPENMLLQNKYNKISDSLGVQGGKTHPLSRLKKMENDKEKPKKEINLLLSGVRWNWILTKIMLL